MHEGGRFMKKVLAGALILTLVSTIFIGAGPTFAEVTGNSTAVKPPVVSPDSTVRGIIKAISSAVVTIGTTNVTVVLETRYEVPGIKNATLADIKVGMNVTAQTQKINGQPYATHLSVVPILRNFEGNVTAYSYNASLGGSISIKDNSGKISSFKIGAGEFSIQPLGVVLKTGDRVNVTTRRLKDGDEPIAISVIVSIPVEHFSGNVTAFNYNPSIGGNITVVDGGKATTFVILANKFTIRPDGAMVKVGSHVTVTIQTPPGSPQRVATGVEVVILTQSFAGNVTGFSYDPAKGGNITIMGRDGKKLNFVIEAGNFTIQPKDAVVDVGDIVTVVAKVLDGGKLVALRVEVQPKPVTIKGIINNIDQVKKTITIGTTVVSYDDRTSFILHRVLAVGPGLQANATGYEQPNNVILAGSISVEPVALPNAK
jgi:hypothetical protein